MDPYLSTPQLYLTPVQFGPNQLKTITYRSPTFTPSISSGGADRDSLTAIAAAAHCGRTTPAQDIHSIVASNAQQRVALADARTRVDSILVDPRSRSQTDIWVRLAEWS